MNDLTKRHFFGLTAALAATPMLAQAGRAGGAPSRRGAGPLGLRQQRGGGQRGGEAEEVALGEVVHFNRSWVWVKGSGISPARRFAIDVASKSSAFLPMHCNEGAQGGVQ